MPKTRKRDAKDFARKQTLNPPTGNQKPQMEQRDPMERRTERQAGQYTERGTPPLTKK
jgi:hypothetical protein